MENKSILGSVLFAIALSEVNVVEVSKEQEKKSA